MIRRLDKISPTAATGSSGLRQIGVSSPITVRVNGILKILTINRPIIMANLADPINLGNAALQAWGVDLRFRSGGTSLVSKGGSESASLIAKINEEVINPAGARRYVTWDSSGASTADTGRSTVTSGPVASEIQWMGGNKIQLPPAPTERGRAPNKLVNETTPQNRTSSPSVYLNMEYDLRVSKDQVLEPKTLTFL